MRVSTYAREAAAALFLCSDAASMINGAIEQLISAPLNKLATDPVPPPSTVLDAGCGTGNYLAAVLDALPAARGLP